MKITVKLYAHFREGRFAVEEREYPAGALVSTVSESLGLSVAGIGITLLNGRHAKPDAPLKDGDVLAFFPLVGGG